jgi:hypothetical protein
MREANGVILLWGLANDPALAAVREALVDLGATTVFLDQRQAGISQVELETARDVRGAIVSGSARIDLSGIQALYLRPYDVTRLPDFAAAGPVSDLWQHAVAFDATMLTWAELTSALVVNRPSAMAANNSKPYQLDQIRPFFHVPETLITTDREAAREFWHRHGTVIYKSISGTRSRVRRLTGEHLSRLDDLQWCPTQFQRYIGGTDYRVHVVAGEVFAARIESEADDYRYPETGAPSPHATPCGLPEEIHNRCRELVAALSLAVAGLDLRRDGEGDWYCFEANPCPAFTCFGRASGQAIASRIARLLAGSGG